VIELRVGPPGGSVDRAPPAIEAETPHETRVTDRVDRTSEDDLRAMESVKSAIVRMARRLHTSCARSEITMRLRIIAAALALGLVGCAPGAEEEETGETTEAISGDPSCSPARGRNAVSLHQKALHDAIAFAEGTQGRGRNDGYDVGYAYRNFTSCARHAGRVTCGGGYCSTAAGRYQFLKRTWDATSRDIDADGFGADDQERGAEYLIQRVRRVTVPARAMTATEFSNALKKLSYEWASLPPGRYGQPIKTESQVRAAYCQSLGGSCAR